MAVSVRGLTAIALVTGIALASLAGATGFVGVAAAGNAVEVSSCTVIDEAGSYELTGDVTDGTTEDCIEITSSDVVFEGMGHTIDGVNDDSFSSGVLVGSSVSNVTVSNLTAVNWGSGIEIDGATDINLTNNVIFSNGGNGIRSQLSSNLILTDNVVNDNGATGIAFVSDSDNTLTNNTANRNAGAGISASGSGHELTDNSVNDNGEAGLTGGSDATVVNLTANGNRYGIDISLDDNAFENVTANDNAEYGIYLDGARGHTFANVTAQDNGLWDFFAERNDFLDEESTATVTDLDVGSTVVSFETRNVAISGVDSTPSAPVGYLGIGQHLNATNTAGSGWLNVTLSYSGLDSDAEDSLGLWRYDGADWNEVAGSAVDTAANTVSANVTSFSTFAPLVQDPMYISSCTIIDEPGTYRLIQNFSTDTSFDCIEVYSSDVFLDGMGYTIDLEGEGATAVAADDLTNLTVTNLTATNGTSVSYAVHFDNVTGGVISNVTANETYRGFWLRNGANNTVRGTTVDDVGDFGFYVDEETNLTIRDSNVTGTGDDSMDLDETTNATIHGNVITTSDGYGINADRSDDLTITENVISDAGGYGIDASGEGSVLVRDNDVTNVTDDGIYVFDYDDTDVSDNYVTGAADAGIDVDGGDGSITVKNNTVSGNGDGGDFDYGISVSGDNATVVDNDVTNTDGTGLDVIDDNQYVANNTVSSSSSSGIVFDGEHSTIEQNKVADSDGVGIRIELGNHTTVSDNTIRRSGSDGIYVLYSFDALTGLDIRDNSVEDSGNRSIALGICSSAISDTTIRSNEFVNGTAGIAVVSLDHSWCSDPWSPPPSVTNVTVTDNAVRDARANGIVVDVRNENTTLTDVTFAGGNVSNSAMHAVFFDNATDVTVSNVTLDTTGGDGIRLNASSGNAFSNVTVSDAMGAAVRFTNDSKNTATDLHLDTANVSFEARDAAVHPAASPPNDPVAETSVGQYVNATVEGADAYLDLTVAYSDADVADLDESTLSLWRHDDTDWSEVGGSSVATTANTASGNVTETGVIAPFGTEVIPPDADAGADQTVDVNTVVSFDASSSTDNVGIDSYAWEFGDGATDTGATPNHTYSQPGTYTVNLTVADAVGNSDGDTVVVTVDAVSSGGGGGGGNANSGDGDADSTPTPAETPDEEPTETPEDDPTETPDDDPTETDSSDDDAPTGPPEPTATESPTESPTAPPTDGGAPQPGDGGLPGGPLVIVLGAFGVASAAAGLLWLRGP